MPSEIWKCLMSSCSDGVRLWPQLADLLIPMILEFAIVGLLINWILVMREERRSAATRITVVRRLLVLADRFLCSSVESSQVALKPRKVMIGGVEVAVAFKEMKPVKQTTILAESQDGFVVEAWTRERLSDILSAHGHLFKPEVIGDLTAWEGALEECERLHRSGARESVDSALRTALAAGTRIFMFALAASHPSNVN